MPTFRIHSKVWRITVVGGRAILTDEKSSYSGREKPAVDAKAGTSLLMPYRQVRPLGLVAVVAIRTVAKAVVHGGPETLVDQDAVPAGMARTAFIRGTARMTGETVLLTPPHRMRIGMSRQTGHPFMALGTLLRLGARMTVVAVLINPTGGMRVGMARDQIASMAHPAIGRLRRTRMAGVAMRRSPARSMRIRMGIDRPLMAQGTSYAPFLAGMTLETVVVTPARVMALRPGLLVTGCAGVLLMTYQTLRAVPCRLDAMGLQTPQVVVGRGLGYLVTLPAGRLAVTHRAGLLILA